MKKYIFFLSMILAFQVHAQYPIVFDGYVYDSSGAGIANKTIDVSVLIGPSYVGFTQLTTNTNGNFDASFNISDSAASFKFLVFDCFGDSVIWTEFWNSNISDSLITSIQICNSPVSSCPIDFDFQYVARNTFAFQAILPQNPTGSSGFNWDFGDGNNSSILDPSHLYNGWGPYQVCLNYFDSLCSDTICKTVYFQLFQKSIFVEIQVSDSNGNPVPNAIIADLILYRFDTMITDNMGHFEGNRNYYVNFPKTFWMIDCNGDTIQKNYLIKEDTDTLSVVFNSCGDTIVDCKVGELNQTLQGLKRYAEVYNPNVGDFTYSWIVSDINDFGYFLGEDSIYYEYNFNMGYSTTVFASSPYCSFWVSDSIITQTNCEVKYDYLIKNDTAEFFSQVYPLPSPSATYLWDFGDGNTSTHINPEHSYSFNGTYEVCLTFNDNTCSKTFCDTIEILNAQDCDLNFTYQDFGSAFGFYGIDSFPGLFTSYSWDFGDGNSSIGLDAVHNYQNPGLYEVCLNRIDSTSSCSYCDSILVSFDTSSLTIGGNITINSAARSGDLVIIYEETNTGSAPFVRALDSTLNVDGAYLFYGLNPGAYLIKTIPENSSGDPGLIPHYWQNEKYWGDASSLLLNSSQQGLDFNFNLNPSSHFGPGSVIVSVRDSANQFITDAVVWIEDSSENVIDYKITSQNTDVLFDDLPYGNYKVGTDYPGFYMIKQDVTLSNSSPSDSIGLSLRNGWLATSLKRKTTEPEIKIFPNPVSDYVIISSERVIEELFITDLSGKNVDFHIENKSETESRIKLNEPENGLYIIIIKTESAAISRKLIVKQN